MSEPPDERPSTSPLPEASTSPLPEAERGEAPNESPPRSPTLVSRLARIPRTQLGVALGFGFLVIAVVAVVVFRTRGSRTQGDAEADGVVAPLEPIVACVRGEGMRTSDTRVTTLVDRAPLAEALRNAGIAPQETYRVRRALEAIPGYLGGEPGRFVGSRGEGGAIDAFHLLAGRARYAARTDGEGQLLGERVTASPVIRLCSGVVRLEEDLNESLATSVFEPDLASAVSTSLDGRVTLGAETRGGELRLVVREIVALGDFAGYDGLEAIEVRPPGGAAATRLYAVGAPDLGSAARFVDADGKAIGASEPTAAALATLKSRKTTLDAALDAATESSAPAAADEGEGGAPPETAELDTVRESDPPIREDPKRTVAQAMNATCSTRIVAGLSRQIIAEARCLNADAFTRIPPRKNLVASSNVFMFLEAPARDRLLRVLDAHPKRTMTINSALRTVAQQVLLSKWGETRRCGVRLAALPSESNHESGTALDVQEHGTWRKALEKEGFRWMGKKDPVHFDYVGPGAVDHRGLDVRAFQRLWNRNNREDPVPESGDLDARTSARLLKSPANGFAIGARCSDAP